MDRPGDRVFFEPGEDHWHGAAPARFMTHLAMQKADGSGSPVTWCEHVTTPGQGMGYTCWLYLWPIAARPFPS